LRRTLIDKFLFEADFSLQDAEKSARRGDVAYVTGSLYRTIACLTQVLFAVNERYCTNEKGALRDVGGFARAPEDFGGEAMRVLGATGRAPVALAESIAAAGRLAAAVRALAA
jgi:hypothetical protein